MTRVLSLFASLAMGMALCGCGDGLDLKPATGTVTYNGKPVEGADVLFTPKSGPPGTGRTDASGKFEISTSGQSGATVGTNEVTISKVTGNTNIPVDAKPEDMMKMAKAGELKQSKQELPTKYSVPQGGLTADVKASGENNFTFDLKD